MYLFSLFISLVLLSAVQCASLPQNVNTKDLNQILAQLQAEAKKPTHCSLSHAQLPLRGQAPELPYPGSGLRLKYITYGVGTQNYTCAGPSATPSSIGAVAALYDASCLVHLKPRYLDYINRISLQLPEKTLAWIFRTVLRLNTLGNHHFSGGVPFFDLRALGGSDNVLVSLASKVPAPSNVHVDWLKLDRKEGSGIEVVFRVQTNHGKAPATCRGMKPTFEVRYTAEYWLYGQ
ncbi:hypothetical protein FQN57_006858 [Myotisia sp. PD_48]|nr:hypothetical protein FQN57_006858 [Myotisia sp. PD_48]